ncbi:T9SS type A sorting domain-containing protein [Hymenobacter aquaticus]|uniref:T9SS type A sorting domain-containing protein n=1 Tax=Hymenobacter aquaticus TaxID=1867101 RepID=A0A4Z0Q493_9BACT|nr:T9SS type A sorting domain-containing protein [Hymenobacter aquaticus]TGE23943.1 T9SS type A sorting domain-containing protein [Hymenobacter aquaticus]
MPISTPDSLRRAAFVLAAFAYSLPAAQAQINPPTWLNAYAPGFAPTAAGALASDAAGNTYAAGSFTGSITIGTTTLVSRGLSDGYLVKYTPTGTVAWVFSFSTASNELATDVALDAAGNAYVTGTFTGPIPLTTNGLQLTSINTASKVFVVRVSPQGVPQWAAQSSPAASTGVSAASIGTDALGNVYATGLYTSSMSFGTPVVGLSTPTGFGAFLLQLRAATGEARRLTPAFDYQPPSGPTTYQPPRLAVAARGDVYVVTSFTVPIQASGSPAYTPRGNNDLLLIGYDPQGQAAWVRQEGGPSDERVNDVQADADGNLYLAGSFAGPTTFGTIALPGAGGLDGYLAKYSPLGALSWVAASGGPGSDGWGGLSLDPGGKPHVAGYFNTGARYGSLTLTSAGGNDVAVAAYRPDGQLDWVQQAGGPGSDVGYYVGVGSPYYYAFGTFSGTCAFDNRTVSSGSAATGNFLARLGDPTLTTAPARPQALGLFPNPAAAEVSLPGLLAGTRVQLFDARGRVARETTVSAAARVSVRGLAPGLYTLRTTDAQGQPRTGKLVVE